MSIGFFDVVKHMVDSDNKALQLAPLGNVSNIQKTKRGTLVTIGVAGDVVHQFATGKLIGGLIIIDKEEFAKAKAEIEKAGA